MKRVNFRPIRRALCLLLCLGVLFAVAPPARAGTAGSLSLSTGSVSQGGSVTLRLDATVLGLGILAEDSGYEVKQGQPASYVVKEFLEDNGFEVTNIVGMDVSYIRCNGRKMEACDEYFLYRNAINMDLKGADTFFLSCMGLATMELVQILEEDLGMPVITSHQASLWACLRHSKVNDKLSGLGKLFTI